MFERARSAGFAAIGASAAVGLALVALTLQLGVPAVGDLPLPALPSADERSEPARPPAANGAVGVRRSARGPTSSSPAGRAPARNSDGAGPTTARRAPRDARATAPSVAGQPSPQTREPVGARPQPAAVAPAPIASQPTTNVATTPTDQPASNAGPSPSSGVSDAGPGKGNGKGPAADLPRSSPSKPSAAKPPPAKAPTSKGLRINSSPAGAPSASAGGGPPPWAGPQKGTVGSPAQSSPPGKSAAPGKSK